MSLDNIFGKPKHVESVGLIYPVRMKDYDRFIESHDILLYSKKNFNIEKDNIPLLLLIMVGLPQIGVDHKIIIKKLTVVFQIVLRTDDVKFFSNNKDFGFLINNDKVINCDNYDEIRKIIMEQNLLFEPKVYKNKLVAQWAEKVIKARYKNSIKIEMEDKIDLIHNTTGIPYKELEEQTIYHIEKDFARICKIKGYDTQVNMACAGAKDIKLNYFAETINLHKDPYEDLFVDRKKIQKLDSAFK